MTTWIIIDHAPKDRPVDLWGAQHTPEMSSHLMMVHSIYMRRWPDCKWSPCVMRPSGLQMNLSPGWYFRIKMYAGGDDTIDDWMQIYPTHFMLIPDGPVDIGREAT